MANSDLDLKWLIITTSCQRVAEVNLSVYWTTREISLSSGRARVAGHRAAGNKLEKERKKECDARERKKERKRKRERGEGARSLNRE